MTDTSPRTGGFFYMKNLKIEQLKHKIRLQNALLRIAEQNNRNIELELCNETNMWED